jgi:hypothetical protein
MSKPKPTAKTPKKKAEPKKDVPKKKAAAPTSESERTAAETAYIEATIARGEAQPADPSGELPEGATHELIETPSGEQIIRRKRFSAA